MLLHVLNWQNNRGSTNMDLSRDDEGATQDRSNAPITTPHDPEQVDHHTSTDIIITIAAIFSKSTTSLIMLTKRPVRQHLHCRLVKPSAVASSSEKCARRSRVGPSDRQVGTVHYRVSQKKVAISKIWLWALSNYGPTIAPYHSPRILLGKE